MPSSSTKYSKPLSQQQSRYFFPLPQGHGAVRGNFLEGIVLSLSSAQDERWFRLVSGGRFPCCFSFPCLHISSNCQVPHSWTGNRLLRHDQTGGRKEVVGVKEPD